MDPGDVRPWHLALIAFCWLTPPGWVILGGLFAWDAIAERTKKQPPPPCDPPRPYPYR